MASVFIEVSPLVAGGVLDGSIDGLAEVEGEVLGGVAGSDGRVVVDGGVCDCVGDVCAVVVSPGLVVVVVVVVVVVSDGVPAVEGSLWVVVAVVLSVVDWACT
ncbi:MAG TPA: hypothetical protein VI032_19725 [Burkholderiaceae bacterium]